MHVQEAAVLPTCCHVNPFFGDLKVSGRQDMADVVMMGRPACEGTARMLSPLPWPRRARGCGNPQVLETWS